MGKKIKDLEVDDELDGAAEGGSGTADDRDEDDPQPSGDADGADDAAPSGKGGALVVRGEMDEESQQTHFSITEVLGSGLIGHKFLRRNWGVLATIIFLTFIYVSNRYAADQELIRINDLQKELEEVRYRALTHNSELTMRCRQSYIEDFLRSHGDTTLVARKTPPFIIVRNTK